MNLAHKQYHTKNIPSPQDYEYRRKRLWLKYMLYFFLSSFCPLFSFCILERSWKLGARSECSWTETYPNFDCVARFFFCPFAWKEKKERDIFCSIHAIDRVYILIENFFFFHFNPLSFFFFGSPSISWLYFSLQGLWVNSLKRASHSKEP